MRRPTISRKSAPVAIGGGVVAVSVIAGSCVVALSGGPGSVSDASGAPAASGATAAASVSKTATPSGAEWAADLGGNRPGATPLSLPFPVPLVSQSASGATAGSVTGAQNAADSMPPRLVVPDVIASVRGGVTAADLAKLRKIGQVRSVLPVAGAKISVNGKPLTVVGASGAELRSWMPPDTAANASVWSAFAKGDLITTAAAAKAGSLSAGTAYDVSAAVRTQVTFGTSAPLGIAGVDGIVSTGQAKRLGLVKNVAVLINAPAANMSTLVSQVRSALGDRSQVIRLVPLTVSTKLPVDTSAPTGTPTSYMSLYQESAAQYCPGLSWTVLAAIGQIESADGTNDGPSSAGALGPMQFLPSTWKIWGITAFGQTGAPNIMNPFDAVPSAARMLCADGAGDGGQDLRQAIFDYNHADWYVDEVLTLANEYGSEFS
ncbi:MAG TPA: lytic transglycosylase domain-containing protein [Trebonia sp.]|nr:lytic transglycosylase domain-containing protein [Trebonia sp.]